mgnify:CR=1 FL=1
MCGRLPAGRPRRYVFKDGLFLGLLEPTHLPDLFMVLGCSRDWEILTDPLPFPSMVLYVGSAHGLLGQSKWSFLENLRKGLSRGIGVRKGSFSVLCRVSKWRSSIMNGLGL